MTELSTADIDDFYAHLRRARGRDARPLAPGTVHRVHVVLRRASTQAMRWEWIWPNPASHASPPRVLPAEIRPPSPVQVGRLLAVVRDADPSFYTYLRLAATPGACRSQLLALRWSDIDRAHSAIGFSRALVEGPSGPVLQPTKNRRTYRVALDHETLATVIEHARRRGGREATADVEPEDGFVFSDDPTGRRPWQPNWVTKRFIRYRQHAGPAQFRPHDLRHFMATTMLAAGVPVPVVSERLCHTRTSTTVNSYADAMPGADRNAANLLADLLHL